MRYALIIIAFFFCTIKTDAQVYQAMPQAGYGPVKRMLIDSVLTIPIGLSQLRNITGGRDTAQLRYQKSDSSVYVYSGSTWIKLGTGGGGGGSADSTVFFTVYRSDTMRANIYAAIPQPDTFYVRYPVRVSNDTIYLAQSFVDSVGTGGGGAGGGSGVNYYLNGSINQGTFGGDTYYQLSTIPVLGAGTNFTRNNSSGNGYIANFITDAGDPNITDIPGGNWNLEFYFNSSSSGGSPQFYGEVYKYDGTNFTLIASGSVNPEGIDNGTTVDQYFTSISVPQTTLTRTDRLAVRVYVIPGGRNITLHTENSNLSEVLTTINIPVWRTAGNSSVDAAQFIGSTNNASLRFRTNNTERMVLDSIGGMQMASIANNGTLTNALQLANTNNRSFFNISTASTATNLTLKANANAIGDSLVISDTGLIQARSNTAIWLKGNTTQTGYVNVNAWRSSSAGAGSIFSANVGSNTPIFNMLSTGQMSIGAETPASTSALDITSTTRGLLIPRLTSTQRNAISTPASQLIVANTTDKTVDMYNGTSWNTIGGGYTDEIAALQTMGATIKTAPIGQPVLPVTASAMVSARSYFSAIYLNREATITGASWFQSTQGVYVGTGGGYNGIGLYRDSLGTLLLVDSTTRDTTIWKAATNTWNQKAFAGGTRTLQPGVYYLMALVNTVSGSFPSGQTAPSIGNWSTPSGNGGTFTLVSNSRKIMGGVQTGVTALPTSQAMTAWNNLANFYYSLYLY